MELGVTEQLRSGYQANRSDDSGEGVSHERVGFYFSFSLFF